MNRVYKALSYIKKELNKPKFKKLNRESKKFDWAFDELYSEALSLYDLSEDEQDCLASMVDDLF